MQVKPDLGREVLDHYPLVKKFYQLIGDRQVLKPDDNLSTAFGDMIATLRQLKEMGVSAAYWDDTLGADDVMATLNEIVNLCKQMEIHGNSKIQHTVLNLKTHALFFINTYKPATT